MILKVEQLCKTFTLHRGGSVLQALTTKLSSATPNYLHAVSDISFEADRGEVISIIGNNGAGKSTLLKVIAGILTPTKGSVTVPDATLFLGGLSRGFPPQLSVRDTVYYILAIAGRTPQETAHVYDAIISFAELSDHQDAFIYQLSRGMVHRLAFAIVTQGITTHTPELLLLDEVFSKGGDIHFRNKTEATVANYISQGSTVLMTSHNLALLEEHCTRILWLEKGKLKEDGVSSSVLSRYRNSQPVSSLPN